MYCSGSSGDCVLTPVSFHSFFLMMARFARGGSPYGQCVVSWTVYGIMDSVLVTSGDLEKPAAFRPHTYPCSLRTDQSTTTALSTSGHCSDSGSRCNSSSSVLVY